MATPKKVKPELPVEPISDYQQAYLDTRQVAEHLKEEIERLNYILYWTYPRLENDAFRGTLNGLRSDPNLRPTPMPAKKKSKSAAPKSSKTPKPDPLAALDAQIVLNPPPKDSPETIAERLPEATAAFLATVPPGEMNWQGANFDHMSLLRKTGLLALVGADNQITIPPRLSPLGEAVRDCVKRNIP